MIDFDALLFYSLGLIAGIFGTLATFRAEERRERRRREIEARYALRTNRKGPNRDRSRPGPLSGA